MRMNNVSRWVAFWTATWAAPPAACGCYIHRGTGRCLFRPLLPILLGLYLEVKLLGHMIILSLILKKGSTYLFVGSGRGREKEGEKQRCVQQTLIGCLLYAPRRGDQASDLHFVG